MSGGVAYVLGGARPALTPVDVLTGAKGTPIALDHPVSEMAITPDGRLAVVTQYDGQPIGW